MGIELWPREPKTKDDQITVGFFLEGLKPEDQEIWYRLPLTCHNDLSSSCDPYAAIAVFLAMQNGRDLVIHGSVSPSLLKNLEEFQAVWNAWRPDRYQQIQITADHEAEQEKKDRDAIVGFSGGVDSCFSYWRHSTGHSGRSRLPVRAGLMIHGFDIRLNQPEVFERAALRQQIQVESLGGRLIQMATNAKKCGLDFDDGHAAILASGLMLLSGGYSAGLIPSSSPYESLHFPWGSNPLTDRLLSSASFRIVHDGAGFARMQKIAAMARWPEFLQYMRVCTRGKERDVNCCRCEKCIRTILEFRALGLPFPPAFTKDVSPGQILRLNYAYTSRIRYYRDILQKSKENNRRGTWLWALKAGYIVNRARYVLKQTFPQLTKTGRANPSELEEFTGS